MLKVAAQPTGWEVGGGPPGAAPSIEMGFFKIFVETCLN
tara:strand:- start:286 stop:402 length:117 start_codon:yes stop_codon:yes gene_type:complete